MRTGTAVLPRHEVWRTDAPRPELVPQRAGLVTDMQVLAELDPEPLRLALLPLAEGYRTWLKGQLSQIGDPDARLAGHEQTARDAIAQAEKVANAIADGIDVMCNDADALDAFRFANQAMWKQRVHTVAIEARTWWRGCGGVGTAAVAPHRVLFAPSTGRSTRG